MDTVHLRGHRYRRIGTWQGMPVWQTPQTDSTFRDRQALEGAAVLVTAETTRPNTSEGSWPAPPGNLYLSLPATPAALSAAVSDWVQPRIPALALALRWEDGFGAHRLPDGRFLSGMVEGAGVVGLDLHLNADYTGHEAEHAALAGLLGRPVPIDEALWGVLARVAV